MIIALATVAMDFIGRNLIKKVSDIGHKVIGVSKRGGVGDVLVDTVGRSDQRAISHYRNCKLSDAAFHVAAFVSPVPSALSESTAKQSLIGNVRTAMNLLAIHRKRRGIRLIYGSSASVYGYQKKLPVTEKARPQSFGFHPLGKFFGELICQQDQRDSAQYLKCNKPMVYQEARLGDVRGTLPAYFWLRNLSTSALR